MTTERETRQDRIDRQLAKAGWAVGSRRVLSEMMLASTGSVRDDESRYCAGKQFVDYALLDSTGRVLAIVEAKRTGRDPTEGQRQTADYADLIREKQGQDPFIFLANGDEVWFWHRKLYPYRQVSGFFNEEDLQRIAHLDKFGLPLAGASPSESIVDRAYQIEAIKTVAERIEQAHRRFLMVLATGTGKTRIAAALVEVLQRHERIQRVLFLADRRELVKQALGTFKDHLPDAPRCWIEGGSIDKNARIHFATYPGMMGIYQRLSPGYYDLIIADESHRSIYNRYKAILDHFDSLQLGLTATPTEFIDHNTFQLFNCDGDMPSYHYGYEEAVRDRYLVPYRPVHVARTEFQIEGLKPGQLPEEVRDQVAAQGMDPDQFSFEGTDLERRVSNTGTNDAIVREFMEHSIKDASGTLPAKTIIFAVSHRHALELEKSFNRLFPDLQRRGMARVIDSQMERADQTLDDFKNKDQPRVAISVDMLDTGIDVPAIRNLVFAKPVFSKVKFWQMLGRGTRPWKDPLSGQEKADFLVIDHWDNFGYFQVNKDGREGSASVPLPTRLFRLRLEKLQILFGRSEARDAAHATSQLRRLVGTLPLENLQVAPHSEAIREMSASSNPWNDLSEERIGFLNHTIAPLLRFSLAGSYHELQFENLTEQLVLAQMKADDKEAERLAVQVMENLTLLPAALPEIRPHHELLASATRAAFWQQADYTKVMQVQEVFAPLMRFRNRRPSGTFVKLSLPDEIKQRHWLIFGPSGEGTFAETYRARVEALVRDLADDHPALQRLKRGEELGSDDLATLAETLNRPDLFVTEESLREAYEQPSASLADFLRHILEIAKLPSREESISHAFDAWVNAHPALSATQLMFVRTLRKAVLERAELSSLETLRQSPFTSIGDPEALFPKRELDDLLHLAQSLAA
jgi:type I restriction enzyme R subunit